MAIVKDFAELEKHYKIRYIPIEPGSDIYMVFVCNPNKKDDEEYLWFSHDVTVDLVGRAKKELINEIIEAGGINADKE